MKRFLFAALIGIALLAVRSQAGVVINEIMFHPAGLPENPALEWVELYNADPADPVDLSGWKLSRGIDFLFPAGTTLAPGGYLVVAANVEAFNTAHPEAVIPLIGGWSGKLSNSEDTIRLENPQGTKIHEVSYADEGDWAVRARDVVDLGHQGWMWSSEADGNGKSLELRNAALFSINNGQNWASSVSAGGSPGALNGHAATDIAPLISSVSHRPAIPRPIDPITVSARIDGESNDPATVHLRWRVGGTAAFTSTVMTDSDADGRFEAVIPPQANLEIVEFYIQANDAAVHLRTWPAQARTSAPGVLPETYAQVANALFQVDNSFNPAPLWSPGAQPVYRVILTAAERTALNQVWTNMGGAAQSNAAFNATFISLDGTGQQTHYLSSVRNRGNGSRTLSPNNALVSFPGDALWNGRRDIALNSRYPHSQTLGALMMSRMGIAVQDTAPAHVRYNGVNLAVQTAVMYGSYARVEQLGSDWVKHHFPLDAGGNLYQVRDIIDDGDLRYEGANPAAYTDSYFKQTNADVGDWSDIVRLCDVLNNAPAAGYKAAVSQVIDLDQWLTYLAANSLVGNREGGISTGRGDDYSLYRGEIDTRFRLVEHDLDTTFGFGGVTAVPNNSIFTDYSGLPGLSRLLSDPAILPDYYAKYLDLIDRVFNPATANPLIDQALGYLAATQPNVVAAAKTFVVNRRAGVLAQIQQNYAMSVVTGAADLGGYLRTLDGSATISGTFHVGKTRSISVNGLPATLYYRTNGTNPAGSWRVVIPAGSTFFKPGMNSVTANFYNGVNGTGDLLTSLSATVVYSTSTTETAVSGTLIAPGTLSVTAPAGYLPGVPVLVRVDLRDADGHFDRQSWNRTAVLSASNNVTLSPGTVTLYNGVGSALVTI
ncbi:MAG: CotH kinase family protein, partial [Verrucomicrobiota bacterium]